MCSSDLINRHTAIDFIDSGEHLFVADSALLLNRSELLFQVEHHWWELGLRPPNVQPLGEDEQLETTRWKIQSGVVGFGNKSLVLLRPENVDKLPAKPMKTDYLLVSGNPRIRPDQLSKSYLPRWVILDASNSYYNNRRWAKKLTALGWQVWNMSEQGAFTESW